MEQAFWLWFLKPLAEFAGGLALGLVIVLAALLCVGLRMAWDHLRRPSKPRRHRAWFW